MKKYKRINKIPRALYASLILFSPLASADANTLGADSVYTLTPVSQSADNTITQAVYNATTDTVTYTNSRLDLNNPQTNSNIFGDNTGTTRDYNIQGLNLTARYSNNLYVDQQKSNAGGALDFYTSKNYPSENITGTFVNNSTKGTGQGLGGAICVGKVGNGNGSIIADFIHNHSYGGNYPSGGALAIDDNKTGGLRISEIRGNFIGNWVQDIKGTSGGAIQVAEALESNYGIIGAINANFIGNYVISTTENSQGGAIDNGKFSKIGSITGDFIRNYAESNNTATRGSQGGAIYTFATSIIGNITGDFIENHVKGTGKGSGEGGALYFSASTEIGNVKGNFISNYAQGVSTAEGGAIYNYSHMGDIGSEDSIFNNNHVIVTATSGTLYARGAAIANHFDSRTNTFNPRKESAIIKNISGKFTGNYIEAASANAEGGVIYNHEKSLIASITDSVFEGSHVTAKNTKGGVLFNAGTITNGISNTNFIGNKSGAGDGGAIYNTGTLGPIANAIFENNALTSGRGGAIYTTKDITLQDNVVFRNNQATTGKDIYLASGASLTITNTDNNATATVSTGGIASENSSSKINVENGAHLDLSGDDTGFTGTTNLKNDAGVSFTGADSVTNVSVNGTNTEISYNNIATNKSTNITVLDNTSTTITKAGKGKLTFNGNASKGTAVVNVNEGIVEHAGQYYKSSVNSINKDSELIINNSISSSNIIESTIKRGVDGSGIFTKNGGATLVLAGDNSSFDGKVNINKGILSYTSGADKSFLNATNYKLVDVATLEINNSGDDDINLNNIVGQGVITKSGDADLEFTSNKAGENNGFTGQLNVSAGNVVANVGAQNSAGQFDFGASVGGNSNLQYNNVSGDSFTLNSTSKVGFAEGANSASITFNGAKFTLTSDVSNAQGNTITMGAGSNVDITGSSYVGNYSILNGSTVNLSSKTNTNFSGDVAIKNSSLNLKNTAVTSTTFSNLDLGTSTDLAIDLAFGDNIVVDTVNATSSNGQFKLTDVNLISTNRVDRDILNETVKVLTGVTFTDDAYSKNISNNSLAYDYILTKNSPDSLLISSRHKVDSLYIMNHIRDEERTFTWNTEDEAAYKVLCGEHGSINTTNTGILHILGRKDGTDTISIVPDESGNHLPHSLFDLSDATDLDIQDVTITGAKGTNGSVISVTSADASVNIDNVLLKDNESVIFVGENAGKTQGKEIVISNSKFENNQITKDVVDTSAIHNEGKMTLNDVEFSANEGVYLYNKGELNINSTKEATAKLDNGTVGGILNDGVINLTSSDSNTFNIVDSISTSQSSNDNGSIIANGIYNITGGLTNQDINSSGITTISNKLKDSHWKIEQGSTGNLSCNLDGGSIINNATLNITAPISISGDILSYATDDGKNVINYSGSGTTTITGNVHDYKGEFNIDKNGVVTVEETGKTKGFFSKDAQINNNGGTLNFNTDRTSITLSPTDGDFAKVNLRNGATFNMTGVESGVYTIGNDWLTTDIEPNDKMNFTRGTYIFEKVNPNNKNTITISNAVFGFDNIEGEPNKILNGYDFHVGNNYVLKDGSTLNLLMHTHPDAEGENIDHYAGDNYIFDSFNSIGNDNKIALNLNLYADTSTPRYPVSDTITTNSGSGILNLATVAIRDDNGGIFTYDKPIRVIYGANSLQIAVGNDVEVLSWSTNVYQYKFKSATSLGVEGLADDNSHIGDSITVQHGGLASSETLRDLNRYHINLDSENQGGNRGFSFVVDKDYHIYRDLDETTKGHFVLLGNPDGETDKLGVISGEFDGLRFGSTDETDRFFEKDGKYYYNEYQKGVEEAKAVDVTAYTTIDADGYYVIAPEAFTTDRTNGSLFELVNETEFEVSDITLKNTLRDGSKDIRDGSAIYANNENAQISLENVNFDNNRADAGNGGAVANLSSSEFTLKNSKITDNYANGDGGSIYNTSAGMILENVTADDNHSGGKGGVIYTNADLIIRSSNFGTTALNTQAQGVANDIYIDDDATVTFNVNNGDSVIKSGIAGSGNFAKIGDKKLTLSGHNSDLIGKFEVRNGAVDYEQTETDGFVSGAVSLASGTVLNLKTANDDHIQNLSSAATNATINKTGSGNLAITGNNGTYTGALNINEGSASYNQTDENGFVNGSVKLADNTSLSITNEKSDRLKNLSGKGTLNKDGSGEIRLTGNNSAFTGDANIDEGSLTYVYSSTSDSYFGGNTILDNDAILNVSVASGLTAEIKNISSKTSQKGNLVKKGAGRATLTGENSNFTGETTVENGTLAYSNASGSFVGGDVDIKTTTSVLEYTTTKDDSLTNKIKGSGRFTKRGNSKLALNNDNSEFNGVVEVGAGTLSFSDSTEGAKFFGNNTKYTVDGTLDIDNANELGLKDLSGSGNVIKSNTGTMNLNGNNSNYKGKIKVNNGNLNFTHNAYSEYISGSTELANSTATLNYTANVKSVLEKVSGNGILNYAGSESLRFDANNNDFTGVANVDGTLLDVIGKSTTDADFTMNVKSGKLNYTAADYANILINDKFNFTQSNNNSTIQFNNASYTLNNEIANSSGNNIIFNNTNIAFNNTQYSNGKYTVKDSIIDLTQDNNKTFDREFTDITIEGSSGLKLDVDLLLRNNAEKKATDTLTVNNANAGNIKVALTQIHVNDKKSDDGIRQNYNFTVLNGLTFDEEKSIGRWATQAYTYDVKAKGTDLELKAVKASDNDSLKEMNQLDGTRGFNFNFTKEDDTTYELASSLGDTNSGKFSVLGDKDRGTTISAGNKYSMFNVTKETDLSLSDLTIEDAKVSDRGGAVVNVNNSKADVLLENVDIHSSESAKNGGAINNTKSESFSIISSEISDNKSYGDGGAIYTASNMYISETDFSNNTDKSGKNDIYIQGKDTVVEYEVNQGHTRNISSGLSGNGVFNKTGEGSLNLSGRNSGFTGTLNISDNSEVKFNQTAKDDSYISGATNLGNNGQLTLNNDKGNITVGNIRGSASSAVNVIGGNDVTLSQDNSGFSGDLNIEDGSVVFNSYTENDKYIKGQTNISKGSSLKLLNNKDFTLERISGEGNLVKSGAGRLLVSGTNELTGQLTINQGELGFKQSASLGDLDVLSMNNGTTLNLQNTLLVQNKDGSFTTNPNPASLEDIFVKTVILNGNVDLKLDIDLKAVQADKIGADEVQGNGQLIIHKEGLNVLTDSLLDNTSVQISYGALANDKIALDLNITRVMGPIQKYSVSYADGYLDFTRVGGYDPEYDDVNPSIMATPVAAQVGGYLTQLETLHSGFYHMDRYMKYTSNMRLSAEKANKYAINDNPVYSRSPLPETSQASWVKPYVSFEKVNLRGGSGVSNTTYGNLYGGDSNLYELKNGFKGVVSAFVGYNGSRQSYSNVSMNQNGGTLGFTGSLYRNNFFTGLTVSTGAISGDAYTAFGHDDFTMLTAGVANKTGYNFEFKEGKFTLQPSLFLGYTFVNTFDYKSKAGVSINSAPLHALQVAPGIKFIGNLKNNTQVYASTDVIMSFLGSSNVKANDVTLPSLSVKPYVQYGVGLQKMWCEKFTAFFQAMVRSGGRNGIMFSAGFRWTLGKDPSKK